MPTSKNKKRPKTWERINHEIVRFEIRRAEEPLIARARSRWKSIDRSKEDCLVLAECVQIQMELLRAVVEARQKIYCSVWERQGETKTREFWDDVWNRDLKHAFEWSEEIFKRELAKRFIYLGFPIGGYIPKRVLKMLPDKRPKFARPTPFELDPSNLEDFDVDPSHPHYFWKKGTRVRKGLALYKKQAWPFKKHLWLDIQILKPFEPEYIQVQAADTEEAYIEVAAQPVATSKKKCQFKGFDGLPKKPETKTERWINAAKLTEKQHKCALLRWVYQKDVAEITRRLELKSRKSVQTHLRAAKAKMDSDRAKFKRDRGVRTSPAATNL